MTVVRYLEHDKHSDAWMLCKCDCGANYRVRVNHLKAGDLKSCGHVRSETDWLKNYKINESTGCWEWMGAHLQNGYGFAKLMCYKKGKKRNFTAHRLFYEHYKGKIPKGLLVCHHCDNRICCNPEHLFLGTHKDNMQDMMIKGRHPFNGKKRPFCGYKAGEK